MPYDVVQYTVPSHVHLPLFCLDPNESNKEPIINHIMLQPHQMIPETTLILLPSSFRQYDIDNPPPPQPANRIQKIMIALVPCNDDQGEGRGRGNGTVPGRLYIGRRRGDATRARALI
jgi:hypothetical protein